jgi:hypothetical protein
MSETIRETAERIIGKPDKTWTREVMENQLLRVTVKSEYFNCLESATRHEIRILLSAIRRIGQDAPKGCSIRAYSIESKNTATIGIENLCPA